MGSHAMDGDGRSALDSIRRIVQALRVSSRGAQATVGVSGAQLFVLQRLAAAPSWSINELAEATLTHQSSVSVVVRRLAERGLASSAASATDGRRREVSLTPRGRRLAARAPEAAQDRLIDGLRRLSSARRRALASGLRALVQAMDLGTGAPPMFFEESHRRARS